MFFVLFGGSKIAELLIFSITGSYIRFNLSDMLSEIVDVAVYL